MILLEPKLFLLYDPENRDKTLESFLRKKLAELCSDPTNFSSKDLKNVKEHGQKRDLNLCSNFIIQFDL